MTTILVTDEWLIADTAESRGNGERLPTRCKIVVEGGSAFALAGSPIYFEAVRKWVRDGADAANPPRLYTDDTWQLVHCTRGRVETYTAERPLVYARQLPYTLGTGDVMALTALHCGLDPFAAIAIVPELDCFSSAPFDYVDLSAPVWTVQRWHPGTPKPQSYRSKTPAARRERIGVL